MNIPLLRRIQRQIDKAPERFDMSYFDGTETPCGTAYCYAGWACVLSGLDPGKVDAKVKGLELLDLTVNQAHQLFFQSPAPYQFKIDAHNIHERAAAGIARIDHFIATEGRE